LPQILVYPCLYNILVVSLEAELIKLLNSYNKSNLDTAQFLPFVKQAIERAKQLDTNPKQRWSNELGTRVYQLVDKIIL
jgi:hypothetical protein